MRKKNITWVFVCAALTISSVVRAGGMDMEGHPAGDAGRHFGPGPGAMEPPPLAAEHILEHLAHRLKLTAEQQKKIGELLTKNREQISPLLSKRMEAQKQAREAMSAAVVDEKLVRDKANATARMDVELAVNHARLRNQINALLTQEQRAGLAQLPPLPPRGHMGKKAMTGERGCPCHMPPPPPCGGEHDAPEDDR